MINGLRVAVVLPAFNAEKTLEGTVREIADAVDIRILVDDGSSDRTTELGQRLGLLTYRHDRNYGYGRNQQTCYREALAAGADIVVMLHPDYQYAPLLVTAMASMIAYEVYDVVLGSRIVGGGALKGGMPRYKYIANRFLTAFQNLLTAAKLSEYHTGLRAFSKEVLQTLPLLENSDDFLFDNQMLLQCIHFGFRIGEVSCPTRYFAEASSINFPRSVKYGLGVLTTSLAFVLHRARMVHPRIFDPRGKKLDGRYYEMLSAGHPDSAGGQLTQEMDRRGEGRSGLQVCLAACPPGAEEEKAHLRMSSPDLFQSAESTDRNGFAAPKDPQGCSRTQAVPDTEEFVRLGAPRPVRAGRRDRGAKWVLMLGSLLLAAVLIVHGIHKGEFNLNVDEPFNAFTGLFFADLLRHPPIAHPVQYAYSYYAHYPAIMVFHWPPFFHFVEGLFFLLVGPSVLTARLVVLVFAVLGLFFWFELVSELENKRAAAVSTVLLALLPQVFLFEKAVMLEVPCLAMCIAASYFWLRYLREARNRFLYAFAVFAGMALLTKQLSAYLALFCLLSAVTTKKWRLLWRWPVARALGIVLLIAGPFYALSLAIDWRSISGNMFVGAYDVPHPFAFYVSALPDQLGWPLLALALLGVVTCRWWTKRENVALMLSWIFACSCMVAFLATRDLRYTTYLFPPLVYFAAAPLTSYALSPKLRLLGSVAALALVLAYSVRAWRFERPYVSGYARAAESVSQIKGSQVILYDGPLAANFMFFLRLHDPTARFIVLRKALFVTAVQKRFGVEELVRTSAQLDDLIKEYGIRYVVVEDPIKVEFDAQKILRDSLNTPHFRLLRAFPIESNAASPQEVYEIRVPQGNRVLFYENAQAVSPSAQLLHIRMLSLPHDIVVPLRLSPEPQ